MKARKWTRRRVLTTALALLGTTLPGCNGKVGYPPSRGSNGGPWYVVLKLAKRIPTGLRVIIEVIDIAREIYAYVTGIDSEGTVKYEEKVSLTAEQAAQIRKGASVVVELDNGDKKEVTPKIVKK